MGKSFVSRPGFASPRSSAANVTSRILALGREGVDNKDVGRLRGGLSVISSPTAARYHLGCAVRVRTGMEEGRHPA